MNTHVLKTMFVSVALGLVFFGVVMGACMGIVMLNVSMSPQLAWFPVPATLILGGAIWWAQRRWDIGLAQPAGVPWGRVYVIGVALTLLGMAVAVVQGHFTGMVRATEVLDAEVSPAFAFTYAIYMSVLAAVLAEATFRGVMQARMQTVLSIWPTVVIIGVINVLAHRWGPELLLNWLGLFVTLAGWTYLRWLSGSLWPPLVLHSVANLVVAVALWFGGPFAHAELGNSAIIAISVAGIAALAVAVIMTRGSNNWGRTAINPH